jgi:hypothetical protein
LKYNITKKTYFSIWKNLNLDIKKLIYHWKTYITKGKITPILFFDGINVFPLEKVISHPTKQKNLKRQYVDLNQSSNRLF